ncbi:hypothetical protein F5Y11DRAFT_339889 [Daldinia sp. FL1419]|nr:hypothetical protein F5Y11DRAFT_339889 [Daldinia sp. FL1419]
MYQQASQPGSQFPCNQAFPTNMFGTRSFARCATQKVIYRSDISDASAFRTDLYRGDDLYELVKGNVQPCCNNCIRLQFEVCKDIVEINRYTLDKVPELLHRAAMKVEMGKCVFSEDDPHFYNDLITRTIYYQNNGEFLSTKKFGVAYPKDRVSPIWSDSMEHVDETHGQVHTQSYPHHLSDYLYHPSAVNTPSSPGGRGAPMPSALDQRKSMWVKVRGANSAPFPGCEPYVIQLPTAEFDWSKCYGTQHDIIRAVRKRSRLVSPVIRLSQRAPQGKEIVLGMRDGKDWEDPEARLLLDNLFDTMVSYSIFLLEEKRSISFAEYQKSRCLKLLNSGKRGQRY